MSVFFTVHVKPGMTGELFAIYSSQGRVLLSVGIDRQVTVSYQDAAAGVRFARTSASGNAMQTEKFGSRIDDGQ